MRLHIVNAGNMDSVKAALLKGGHKKLQHIFEQLLGRTTPDL